MPLGGASSILAPSFPMHGESTCLPHGLLALRPANHHLLFVLEVKPEVFVPAVRYQRRQLVEVANRGAVERLDLSRREKQDVWTEARGTRSGSHTLLASVL